MPPHRVHCFMDRMFFNRSYWRLHKIIDRPYVFLRRGHRRYFHDLPSALAIAQNYFPGDSNAQWAAWMHLELDFLCSENPDLLRMLKVMANRYYGVWKRRKNKENLKVKFSLDFLRFFFWFFNYISSKGFA